jgi:deoxyadenosine/deoxycytidine kinase
MPKNIVGLEGSAFAGKTTLLKYLRENHSDRVSVVPEASEIVGGDKHFPAVPFADFEAAKFSTNFFLELEKERSRIAKNLLVEKDLPVILDRSTMISTTLFFFMLEKTHPDLHKFPESFLDYALQIFAEELDLETFIVPAMLVYLRPKNRAVFESRLGRGTKNQTMAQWDGFRFLDRAYQTLLGRHFSSPGQNIRLKSENTEQNLQSLAVATLNFVDSSKTLPKRNLFRDFFAKDDHLQQPVQPDLAGGDFSSARKMLLDLMEKAGTNK